jgi:Cd2+/Zn2+-exporting ATPase
MKYNLKPFVPFFLSLLFLLMGVLSSEQTSPTALLLIFSMSYFIVARKTLWKAFKKTLRGDIFNEHFLMSIATIGAFFIQAHSEAVAVMLFYEVGEIFQDMAVNRSKKSIQALLDMRPDTVTVMRNGQPYVISPQKIQLGEVVQIKSGERVALDGILLSEKASFNTAALTGESKPDTKYKNQEVLAGMINLAAVSEIRITRIFQDTKLSRILTLVQEAADKKAKPQLFMNKFANIYTPIVMLGAVGLILLPYFFTSSYVFADWLYRALVFLVASCPCALAIFNTTRHLAF